MKTRLKQFFYEYAVPDEIRQAGKLSQIIRAEILASLYISNIVIVFLLLLFFSGALIFSEQNYRPGLYVTLGCFLILALQIYVFYKSRNLEISATIFSMTFFAFTLAGVILSGGWHSPMLLLFFCCPAISFLIGGRSEGAYMSTLVFMSGIGMLAAYHTGFQLFHFDPEKTNIAQFYTWVIATIILTTCLTTYDSLLNELSKKVRKKS